MRSRKGMTRRGLLSLAVAASAVVGAGLHSAQADDALPPNIVVILADDLGYADVGCFGAEGIRTPNLDRMADEGMRFTQFYVAAPTCSPSRAGLLTGLIPQRVGVTRVLFPLETIGLAPQQVTIAEVLRDTGYATACIGKWHLGRPMQFLPTLQGFDYFFGLPYSNDMSPKYSNDPNAHKWPPLPLMRGTQIIETEPDQSLLTRRYTIDALQFIEENRDQPFFLYIAHTMPHVPLFASRPFRGKSGRGLYGDVVEELDWSVGQILDAIDRYDLTENTLVVFTSDNGPWLERGEHGGSATPLRGGKATAYEGGFRVPTIMRWPGVIPEGSTCDEIASTLDFMPTFAALADAVPPSFLDGQDLWPLMTGQPNAKTSYEEFFYWNHTGLRAVRVGPWKLHVQQTRDGVTYPPELYNLDEDVGETRNVIAQYPDVWQDLRERVARHRQEMQQTQ